MTSLLPALDALLQFSEEHDALLRLLRISRVGLITNHTGRTIDGVTTRDALRVLGIEVCALFSPEHGFEGKLEGDIASTQLDNLTVHSLYGATRRPTPEMLTEIDVLIFDIQDVGARFYTYGSTLAYATEECAKFGKTMVVLDRPNPLGRKVEGPMVEDDCRSFIGHVKVPVVHGLTLGELVLLHKANEKLDVDLQVVKCRNWSEALWPQSGLKWIAPSPNLPDFTSAHWYPGLCLLEFSNVAVGRGTEAPFQIIGAPWFDTQRVLDVLNTCEIWNSLDLSVEQIEFTPTRAIYENELCRGLKFDSKNPSQLSMTDFGLTLLWALRHAGFEEFGEEQLRKSWQLVGSNRVLGLIANNDLEGALKLSHDGAREFTEMRKEFVITN